MHASNPRFDWTDSGYSFKAKYGGSAAQKTNGFAK
jgi:hypothetical protein